MPASQREQASVAERRARVLRLKVAGMGWPQIAAEIDKERRQAAEGGDRNAARRAEYTVQHAIMDVKRALSSQAEALADLADLHLALELERIDGLHRTTEALLRQAIQAQDGWQALRAVDRLVNISRRRDSLLGLSHTTAAAVAEAEAEGGSPSRDAVDELARKRARRTSPR